jgi:hypothetical protein
LRDLSGVGLPLLGPFASGKAIYQRLTGVIPEKNEKKQSIQRQAANYGNNARDNRMPLDAAKREIDHGADRKEN